VLGLIVGGIGASLLLPSMQIHGNLAGLTGLGIFIRMTRLPDPRQSGFTEQMVYG
jgi:hypothetical protein